MKDCRVLREMVAKPMGRDHSDGAIRMHTRKPAFWLYLTLAALMMALGTGAGLPGWVGALAPEAGHVCTSARGGSHSSCPLCNARLERTHKRPRRIASDLGVVPSPLAAFPARFEWPRAPRDVALVPDIASIEPPTPPPRLGLA